jgi:hypothetical protein
VFVDPVDIEPALGKKPCAVELRKGVEVTERRSHQAPLSTIDRHVMRQAVTMESANQLITFS